MRNVKWNEGAPEKLERGMLLKSRNGNILLVGDITPQAPSSIHAMLEWDAKNVTAWAWLIQPYQVEWLEAMAKAGNPASR